MKKCAFYIAATEKLSESEKHEIEMDIRMQRFILEIVKMKRHRKNHNEHNQNTLMG